MNRFKDKTVVITGGTSGIGLITAKEFLDEGAKVIFTSRSKENVTKTEKELGSNAVGIVSDAGKMADLWSLKQKVNELTNKVDILFVNAGFGKFNSLTNTTEEEFDAQFNTLVKGGYFTVQQLEPLMPSGSSIVFNTSVVTDTAMPGASVYGGAKSAVKYFSKSFANELKDRKIRVNAVSPGPIGTNFFNEAGVPQEQQEQMAEQILSQVPMNRFGEPKEIAKTVLFLASDDSSFITGHEVQVDGGMVQV
ncbi:short-chain dehydrogenase [Winogradskyella sp. J14-2]|uniref:SDR family oxidoreductase n=1 Tax=Winogradskyella sp. J14-2 TaxID=1936080 RepID=UPI00097272F7|nr:SDR family oxidoreductase [Winogradskyella sp. J14-2]APY07110.1 short-chain dehydrogenase [Winogradskyella sp. J14-2]